jgi:hypothetical protein
MLLCGSCEVMVPPPSLASVSQDRHARLRAQPTHRFNVRIGSSSRLPIAPTAFRSASRANPQAQKPRSFVVGAPRASEYVSSRFTAVATASAVGGAR